MKLSTRINRCISPVIQNLTEEDLIRLQINNNPWDSIIELWNIDRELFYLLAMGEKIEEEGYEILSILARHVKEMIWSHGEIRMDQGEYAFYVSPAEGTYVKTTILAAPINEFNVGRVKQFMKDVDDKVLKGVKDYREIKISEAEACFKVRRELFFFKM